mmetsp:Transcript_120563/g.384954  ORF Transcript_120563/g.384954 Transcript_120563/m.384954 type:complete len:145 (-) Transcript_120563:772-1206(-)
MTGSQESGAVLHPGIFMPWSPLTAFAASSAVKQATWKRPELGVDRASRMTASWLQSSLTCMSDHSEGIPRTSTTKEDHDEFAAAVASTSGAIVRPVRRRPVDEDEDAPADNAAATNSGSTAEERFLAAFDDDDDADGSGVAMAA